MGFYPISKIRIERTYYPRKLVCYAFDEVHGQEVSQEFEFDETDKVAQWIEAQLKKLDQ